MNFTVSHDSTQNNISLKTWWLCADCIYFTAAKIIGFSWDNVTPFTCVLAMETEVRGSLHWRVSSLWVVTDCKVRMSRSKPSAIVLLRTSHAVFTGWVIYCNVWPWQNSACRLQDNTVKWKHPYDINFTLLSLFNLHNKSTALYCIWWHIWICMTGLISQNYNCMKTVLPTHVWLDTTC